MEKPLITMSICCYNQEWCIREALNAAFSQTYSPLEILIFDDCSTDATWSIINEMKARYIAQGGQHKIVAIRNPENAYSASPNVRDEIHAFNNSLVKGELIVQADGDDVSLPNRVEEIYNAWEKTGRSADVIFSGSYLIDRGGKRVGLKSCNSHLSGSSMAYTTRAERFFGDMAYFPLHGDDVRYYRACMLGGVIRLDKLLVNYRICGGYSQVQWDFRKPMIRNYTCVINSRKQLLIDVDKIKAIDAIKYNQTKEWLEKDLAAREAELPLWSSDRFAERFRAYMSMGLKRRFMSGMIVYAPMLLLPHKVGDALLNGLHKFVEKLRRIR